MTDRISRDDIVRVAVALLESGGLHALAMRRIATELGVQQSALYWHVENKQALLAAVADRILEPVAAPDDGDPVLRVASLASSLRAELLRYPDGADVVATAAAFRLGAQRPFQLFVAELATLGLGTDRAEVAASVLVHFVLGFTHDEQQHRQAALLGAIASDPPEVTSADERFLAGVRLIVAGATSHR